MGEPTRRLHQRREGSAPIRAPVRCWIPTVRAMTRQRILAIVALLASSALCVATVEIRTHETGDPYYRFLVWNLILAWAPLAFAIAAYARARGRIDLFVAVLLVPWLLFFPNAPYLLATSSTSEKGLHHSGTTG